MNCYYPNIKVNDLRFCEAGPAPNPKWFSPYHLYLDNDFHMYRICFSRSHKSNFIYALDCIANNPYVEDYKHYKNIYDDDDTPRICITLPVFDTVK